MKSNHAYSTKNLRAAAERSNDFVESMEVEWRPVERGQAIESGSAIELSRGERDWRAASTESARTLVLPANLFEIVDEVAVVGAIVFPFRSAVIRHRRSSRSLKRGESRFDDRVRAFLCRM